MNNIFFEMKCKFYSGLLFGHAPNVPIQQVNRTIAPVPKKVHPTRIRSYVYSGAKAVKFILFDLSICVGAFAMSKKLGASALFRAFTTNGPVIMKLGQFLSTRFDILPEGATARLRSIQNFAPSLPLKRAPLDILYEETGIVIPKSSLKEKIGAGCVAQVYKVEIQGKDYALKIIDPVVREQIHGDLSVFQVFSKLIGFNRFYEEFKRNMQAQVDLRKEKENTQRFRKNFMLYQSPLENRTIFAEIMSRYTDTFIFPKPVIATKNILLTEYWTGSNVNARDGTSILFMFIKMIFKDRFVHSDLHPGNLAVISPAKRKNTFTDLFGPRHKTIVVYDTGLSHELTRTQTQNLKDLIKTALLGRKEAALSLIIERNALNTHSHKEKSLFVKHGISHWNRSGSNKTSIANKAFNICLLTKKHKVFLDSAYTNIMMSGLYVQNYIESPVPFTSITALRSGLFMDYLDVFIKSKVQQYFTRQVRI